MSLLLDALNKADQERKRNETTPGINSNHEHIYDQAARNKLIIIVAAIAGLVILLIAIYWLGQRSAAPAPVVTAPISSVAKSAQPQQNESPAIHQSATATQESASSVEDIDTSEDNVASLYQQNNQIQNSNATLTLSTPPAEAPTPTSNPNNEQPTTPSSITQFANLPDLHDLPSQVLEKIPSLNYSEHNYNTNGGSVKINSNIYHANEQLAGGVVIDKILEDGIILHVDNYSFKMRALNSWINM